MLKILNGSVEYEISNGADMIPPDGRKDRRIVKCNLDLFIWWNIVSKKWFGYSHPAVNSKWDVIKRLHQHILSNTSSSLITFINAFSVNKRIKCQLSVVPKELIKSNILGSNFSKRYCYTKSDLHQKNKSQEFLGLFYFLAVLFNNIVASRKIDLNNSICDHPTFLISLTVVKE